MSVCSKCLQEIRARQHVITCVSCDRDQHRTCGTGVTLEANRESRRTGVSMVYVCTACTSEEVTLMYEDGAPLLTAAESDAYMSPRHDPPVLEISVPALQPEDETDHDMDVSVPALHQENDTWLYDDGAPHPREMDEPTLSQEFLEEMQRWRVHPLCPRPFCLEQTKEVFPGVEMKGCAFHWSQAVLRRVQGVGLAKTYQQRTGLHHYIRRLLSLQFLPGEEIKPASDLLKGRAMTPETQELTHYINNTWIDNNTFPPSAWSVFRQRVRTNNDVEGRHHRINAYAGGQRQQFYRIIPTLRREAELVFTNIRGGDLTRNVRQRSKTLEKQLQQLWDEYMQKTINTSGFLKKCGELYGVRV